MSIIAQKIQANGGNKYVECKLSKSKSRVARYFISIRRNKIFDQIRGRFA